MSGSQTQPDGAKIADARRREMAIEHLLFGTIRFLAQRHPELLDELEDSLAHLWDLADDESRSDEAVRDVARRFLKSLRAEGAQKDGADLLRSQRHSAGRKVLLAQQESSPEDRQGNVYLAPGKRLSMRMWRDEEPTSEKPLRKKITSSPAP